MQKQSKNWPGVQYPLNWAFSSFNSHLLLSIYQHWMLLNENIKCTQQQEYKPDQCSIVTLKSFLSGINLTWCRYNIQNDILENKVLTNKWNQLIYCCRQTDKQTNRETDIQIDRETDRQCALIYGLCNSIDNARGVTGIFFWGAIHFSWFFFPGVKCSSPLFKTIFHLFFSIFTPSPFFPCLFFPDTSAKISRSEVSGVTLPPCPQPVTPLDNASDLSTHCVVYLGNLLIWGTFMQENETFIFFGGLAYSLEGLNLS